MSHFTYIHENLFNIIHLKWMTILTGETLILIDYSLDIFFFFKSEI